MTRREWDETQEPGTSCSAPACGRDREPRSAWCLRHTEEWAPFGRRDQARAEQRQQVTSEALRRRVLAHEALQSSNGAGIYGGGGGLWA